MIKKTFFRYILFGAILLRLYFHNLLRLYFHNKEDIYCKFKLIRDKMDIIFIMAL